MVIPPMNKCISRQLVVLQIGNSWRNSSKVKLDLCVDQGQQC